MRKKLGYSGYTFSGHDPIIDRISVLIRAMRVKPRELADLSGVGYTCILRLLATAEDRNLRKYHAKGMKYATAAALVLALNDDQLMLPLRPAIRVKHLRLVKSA